RRHLERAHELCRTLCALLSESAYVARLRASGAKQRAVLEPLDGEVFYRAFEIAMVILSRDTLAKIDECKEYARHDYLKRHLATVRQDVAAQLVRVEALAASSIMRADRTRHRQ